jgi:hypothetical protein
MTQVKRSLVKSFAPLLLLLAWGCAPRPTPALEPARAGTIDSTQTTPSVDALSPEIGLTTIAPEPLVREITRDEIEGIVVALEQPNLVESTLSPDGRWLAEVYSYDCVAVSPEQEYAYQELRLVKTGAMRTRVMDSQLIACGGLGAYGLAGRFWSSNSRYFYYTDASIGVPDGCGYWSPPYLRVDPVNLQVEPLGSGPISPDGTLLAAWQADRLGVWRVEGERIGLVDIPTTVRTPGPIAWRPDSTAVAFLLTEADCPLGETDLGRLDVAEMRPVVILASREPSFADVVWDAPNRVMLTDESGDRWRYNFLSRELRPIIP